MHSPFWACEEHDTCSLAHAHFTVLNAAPFWGFFNVCKHHLRVVCLGSLAHCKMVALATDICILTYQLPKSVLEYRENSVLARHDLKASLEERDQTSSKSI